MPLHHILTPQPHRVLVLVVPRSNFHVSANVCACRFDPPKRTTAPSDDGDPLDAIHTLSAMTDRQARLELSMLARIVAFRQRAVGGWAAVQRRHSALIVPHLSCPPRCAGCAFRLPLFDLVAHRFHCGRQTGGVQVQSCSDNSCRYSWGSAAALASASALGSVVFAAGVAMVERERNDGPARLLNRAPVNSLWASNQRCDVRCGADGMGDR